MKITKPYFEELGHVLWNNILNSFHANGRVSLQNTNLTKELITKYATIAFEESIENGVVAEMTDATQNSHSVGSLLNSFCGKFFNHCSINNAYVVEKVVYLDQVFHHSNKHLEKMLDQFRSFLEDEKEQFRSLFLKSPSSVQMHSESSEEILIVKI